jgi:hypothetical protein
MRIVTEHSFGRLVERGNRAALVDHDHCVDGRVEQRVEFGDCHGRVLIVCAGVGRHT